MLGGDKIISKNYCLLYYLYCLLAARVEIQIYVTFKRFSTFQGSHVMVDFYLPMRLKISLLEKRVEETSTKMQLSLLQT